MLLALVSESSGVEQQNARVATVYAAAPFGGAIVSLISLSVSASHWRLIFIAGGVLPLLLAPLMAFGMSESPAFRREAHTEGSPKAGSFAAIFTQGRALRTVLLWLSFFLELLLLYLLLNWLPTLLVTDGLTRLQAAAAQIGFNIGGGLAALLIGYLLGGRLRNAGIVITFAALPVLLVALAKAPADSGIISVTVFFLGCSVLAAQAFLYAMAPGSYPSSIRGVGVGAAIAVGRIGSIVGPKLGGLLKSAGHGPSQLFLDLLPVVILGSICALLLAWNTRKQ